MPTQRLEAGVRTRRGVAIIDLRGEVNASAESRLEVAYARAEHRDRASIVLNFSDVQYIDSKGIAHFVTLLMRAVRTGRRLLAYGLSDHYREIFEITRLADFIELYEDEAAALAAAGTNPVSQQHEAPAR
jgi:anti-anti-sigma factor